MEVLSALVDWKKIPSVSDTLVRSWGYGLTGLSESQIRKGLEMTRDHVGYFDLGVFRQYCFQKRQTYQPPPTTARLSDMSTVGNKRFQELSKVTQAMGEEPVGGPIHKATLAGKLDAAFVRGKSAQEIIDYCHRLYA